ncbi:MAG: CBS domain-containing protein [Euryarchaeota archaeon]|jgi:predicted transcriptional regulator|nr:CBS domain-containing protein [Euryarchaeota archaeon]MBT4982523.1 CBS domain-containing protein [Euryarchaeota archaeon]MBT5184754.1 CBS domain-containing protein [Euryarchaeota archaeon]
MSSPNVLGRDASVADALDRITRMNLDHLFIVNTERVPIGRIHAVDVLKVIARKTVNRDIAWMHTIPARQLITQKSFTMKENTPLLKAAALMLTHDLNQLAVTDNEGAIVGTVSPSIVARHLPRYIL